MRHSALGCPALQVDDVMRSVLGVEGDPAGCLETWVENLREWLSRQMGEGTAGR